MHCFLFFRVWMFMPHQLYLGCSLLGQIICLSRKFIHQNELFKVTHNKLLVLSLGNLSYKKNIYSLRFSLLMRLRFEIWATKSFKPREWPHCEEVESTLTAEKKKVTPSTNPKEWPQLDEKAYSLITNKKSETNLSKAHHRTLAPIKAPTKTTDIRMFLTNPLTMIKT